jgi:probable HAF family extracellular repeat protein
LPGDDHSSAHAIAATGQVVGESYSRYDRRRAFSWQKGQFTELLPPQGGTYAVAVGVNQAGQIVGYGDTPQSKRRALLWSSTP